MMKLKVDLDCAKCYKKVKKVLYKFPRELLSFFLFLKDSGELYYLFDIIRLVMKLTEWMVLCDWEQEKSETNGSMKSPT